MRKLKSVLREITADEWAEIQQLPFAPIPQKVVALFSSNGNQGTNVHDIFAACSSHVAGIESILGAVNGVMERYNKPYRLRKLPEDRKVYDPFFARYKIFVVRFWHLGGE